MQKEGSKIDMFSKEKEEDSNQILEDGQQEI